MKTNRRSPFSYFLLLIGLVLAAALPSTLAKAQTPQPVSDDDVNRIASQLYCPVCENVSLDVCSTTACSLWRETIRTQLAAGKTDEEIKQYFVEQFGARVIGIPPRQGFNWLLYAVPPLAALGLAAAGFFIIRNQHRPKTSVNATDPTTAEPDDPLRHKLDQDIQKEDRTG